MHYHQYTRRVWKFLIYIWNIISLAVCIFAGWPGWLECPPWTLGGTFPYIYWQACYCIFAWPPTGAFWPYFKASIFRCNSYFWNTLRMMVLFLRIVLTTALLLSSWELYCSPKMLDGHTAAWIKSLNDLNWRFQFTLHRRWELLSHCNTLSSLPLEGTTSTN